MLRVVHPTLSAGFARHHDASLRQALSQLVAAPPRNMYWDVVSLPFSRGGLGFRSTVRTTNAAFWASWADSPTMSRRDINLWEVKFCKNSLIHMWQDSTSQLPKQHGKSWCVMDSWRRLGRVWQKGCVQCNLVEKTSSCHGWQQLATDAMHAHLVETQIRPRLSWTEQPMLRSQSGPMSGVPFACFPSALSRSSQFRVGSPVIFGFPFPPPHANCRCPSPWQLCSLC